MNTLDRLTLIAFLLGVLAGKMVIAASAYLSQLTEVLK